MARIQYTPYTKAAGYRPQQVDQSNLARIREEGNRTLRAMQENAAAEINNRKEIAQQMKADQEYTMQAEQRNFEIQTQNDRNKTKALESEAQRIQKEYNNNINTYKEFMSGISTLSTAAGQIVKDIETKKAQDEIDEATKFGFDPKNKLLAQTEELKLGSLDLATINSLMEAQASGQDSYVISKLARDNEAQAYFATKGAIAQFMQFSYSDKLNDYIRNAETQLERELTYDEAKFMVSSFRKTIYQSVRDKELNSKLLAPYIKYADKADLTYLTTVKTQETKRNNTIAGENALKIIGTVDSETLNIVFPAQLRELERVYGREEALNKIFKGVFLERNEKGEFYRSLDEIGSIILYPDNKKHPKGVLLKDWFGKNRWQELQRDRVKIDLAHRNQLQQIDEIAFQEDADEQFQALGPNPTEDQVKEAIKTLETKYGRSDPRLTVYEKKYTIEARLRTAEAARIAALPDYEITANDLIALKEVASASEYAAVKQRYDSYNGKWRSKDAEAAVKRGLNVITGTTALGTSKAAQPGAAPALRYFEAQALKNAKVMESAMGGALPALEKAVADEAARYLSSYREPTSVYYRKVEKDGSVSYPNLPGAQNISAANAALRDISNMRVKVKEAGNAEAALRIPNLVMSDARMDQVAQNYGKPGFRPNAKEMAFKGMTNGMPLHEVYNRAFAAAGRKERFASPLQNVGIKVPTHLQKVLNDPAASLVSKMNAVNVAMGNLEPYRNLAASGRAGSPLQKVFVTDPKDDTARSTGSDFVIQSGKRGARYLFPQQGKILKVVRDRPQEFRLEEGAKQRGYGNYVEVRFATPYGAADFLFSHFDKIGDFKVGQIVPRGAFMGTQGRSGSTTGAHISVDAFNVNSPTANPRARDWFLKTYLQQ